MVAEVLFAGGRMDSIAVLSGISESTSATKFDSSYADAAIVVANVSNGFDASLFTATSNILSGTTVVSGESLYVHWETYSDSSQTTVNPHLTLYDSSGFPWFRWGVFNATTNLRMQYNSGTGASPVWTNLGIDIPNVQGTLHTCDLKVTLGSPHTYEVFIGGSSVQTGNFTQASFTNVSKLRFNGSNGTGTSYSQILATRDIPTVGAKVKTSRATAAGANTGWTGAYTDVNEAVGSDVTFETAASNGLKTTHAMGDVTVPVGGVIKTIFQWLRAKHDGSAPTNIKSVIRSGGTDFTTGNLSGMSTGFVSVGARYDVDPNTSAAWTASNWNSSEAGFESAA